MRAAYYEQFGEPDVIQLGTLPAPEPSEKHVIIRIRAAAVGYWDVKQMRGLSGEQQFPVIPGYEVVGVVIIGSGDLQRGDNVVASLTHPGGLAQFVSAPASRTVMKPPQVPAVDAAGLVVNGGTALEGLDDRAGLQDHEWLLVTAAAGGVGSVAVQLGRIRGARVIGVASAENHELLKDLGAAASFDYHDPEWPAQVRELVPAGVDVLLDAAGGDTGAAAVTTVRQGGRALLIAGEPTSIPDGVKAIPYSANTNGPRLRAVLDLAARGQLRAITDSTHPLDDARAALERVASRHSHGRVVLLVE
ncbi:MAG: NADP-dependent oxidoreductase [Candidatus Dormibacteraeota bacterium]|nr:NADP-dependent oxidoreductase [Candidatus Dormibacteraeota bacterium]